MKLAVYYHAYIPDESALDICLDQLAALQVSELGDKADRVSISLTGNPEPLMLFPSLLPKAHIHCWNNPRQGERNTLAFLQQNLEPGWAVCYHHSKGVSTPGDPYRNWRKCMERAVIINWEECVHFLEQGCDTVGAHWLCHERYPVIHPSQRYWGGNFWWATSEYLMTLPPLPTNVHSNGRYYEGEVWIGTGPRAPRKMDMARHWPQQGCSS